MDWTVQGSNSGGGEIFRTCPDRPWGPPSLLYNGYQFFLGMGLKSGWGVTLTPHPLLVPWSRNSRAIPLLPLWAIWPVQSLSACTKVHFTFYLFTPNRIQHTTDNISWISWLEKLSRVVDVLVPWVSDAQWMKNSSYWSMSWPYKSQLQSCLKNTTWQHWIMLQRNKGLQCNETVQYW